MTSLKIYTKGFEMKNFAMLTVAGIINAFGVTIFLSPVKLFDSGISGTSMLLSQISGGAFSLSLLLIILNVPLFLYGLKKQGMKFTIYAIYSVAMYSVAAWLITDVLPVDVTLDSPLAGTDLLLCALFGGMISGVGSGLAIRYGGAMDGIEVMAVIFAKPMGISVGTFVMVYNVILYVICGVILGSWILPLYSIVTYMAALKTVDFIVEGFDRAKCAMIVTQSPVEISRALSTEFESGSTRVDAIGGYTNRQKTIVWFVVNRFQVTKMKDIVHRIDPAAFITIHEVADVFRANL
ncbi:MAG: YitT family protein [Oscillospiraceae bacterium]|nr:YitT family protein [Oscillospiraceae bacterium]